jgi:hypothetical protein
LAGYAVYAGWEKVILPKKHFGYAITAAENSGYKVYENTKSIILPKRLPPME